MTTYTPNQPRLLADFAAAPTRRERAGARGYWRAAQADLFAEPIEHEHQADEPAAPCPVCASTHHDADACPHGTAPSLFPEQTTSKRGEILTRCDAEHCPTRGTDVDRRDGCHYHGPEMTAGLAAGPTTTQQETPTMTTSAQRDESRLEPADWQRIDERTDETVARWATQHHTRRYTCDGTGADVLARLAAHAIGCTEHDLRTSELEEIRARIAERYTGRTFRADASGSRIVEVTP